MLVPRNVLKLHKLTEDNDRYTLGAIRLERAANGDSVAIASDGRQLTVATWAEHDADCYPGAEKRDFRPMPGFATMLPAEHAKTLAKGPRASVVKARPFAGQVFIEESKTNGTIPVVSFDGEGQTSYGYPSAEGVYPDWRQVVPNHTEPYSVTLSTKLVKQIIDAAESVTGTDQITLTVDHANDNSPVTFTHRDSEEGRAFCSILMPYATDNGEQPSEWRPDYLEAIEPETLPPIPEAPIDEPAELDENIGDYDSDSFEPDEDVYSTAAVESSPTPQAADFDLESLYSEDGAIVGNFAEVDY